MAQAVLALDVTKEFISLTDEMIAKFKEKQICSENMNVWIAKVPLKDKGGIISSGDFRKMESYKSGFARVLATPRLLSDATDAKIVPGDYIVYSHVGTYSIYTPVINLILDTDLQWEMDKEPIATIGDRDIIAVIPASIVHAKVG